MPREKGTARIVAEQYCRDFPKASTTSLVNKLLREHPALFVSENACSLAVRKIRGANGSFHRSRATDKSQYQDRSHVKGFLPLPPAIVHLEDWRPEPLYQAGDWLVMGDTHVPYHDEKAIMACWEMARKRKVRGVLLNGDILDCFAVSRWEKDPRKRNFPGEIKAVQEFFAALRSRFKKARIVFKAGNHDLRYQMYLQTKAADLLGIPEFELPEITHCRKHGIEYFDDNRPMLLGKLFALHGHEYKFAVANPVNPARGLFLRAQVSAICNHFHQTSQHSEKNLCDHITSCWSLGCLCDLRPEYMPLNKHNHGFAFVRVFQDLAFEVENFRILDGKVYR